MHAVCQLNQEAVQILAPYQMQMKFRGTTALMYAADFDLQKNILDNNY